MIANEIGRQSTCSLLIAQLDLGVRLAASVTLQDMRPLICSDDVILLVRECFSRPRGDGLASQNHLASGVRVLPRDKVALQSSKCQLMSNLYKGAG